MRELNAPFRLSRRRALLVIVFANVAALCIMVLGVGWVSLPDSGQQERSIAVAILLYFVLSSNCMVRQVMDTAYYRQIN
jgi:hypothetical protein